MRPHDFAVFLSEFGILDGADDHDLIDVSNRTPRRPTLGFRVWRNENGLRGHLKFTCWFLRGDELSEGEAAVAIKMLRAGEVYAGMVGQYPGHQFYPCSLQWSADDIINEGRASPPSELRRMHFEYISKRLQETEAGKH